MPSRRASSPGQRRDRFDGDGAIPLPARFNAGASPPEVELIAIPAGWFWMGWEHGLPDARPRRRVWVDAFALARGPVTRAEYVRYLEATGTAAPRFLADPRFGDPCQPIVGVSWTEAVAYCDWLTRETGRPCRLPTEAEWERAARGGVEDARYPWGDERPAAGGPMSAPPRVGAGPVNGLGLTNLAGTVHEWCLDWYADDAYAQGSERNPLGPPTGTRRVSRGGAWRHHDPWSPVAHRSSLPPHLAHSDYGFRVAGDTPGSPAREVGTRHAAPPTGSPHKEIG
jgi:formylglycine-generating enzyme required for sulfatase activity